jgi:hypothetical protein
MRASEIKFLVDRATGNRIRDWARAHLEADPHGRVEVEAGDAVLVAERPLTDRRLVSMATARQGMALEVSYNTTLRNGHSADDLIRAQNRIDGVQSVTLQRVDANEAQV